MFKKLLLAITIAALTGFVYAEQVNMSKNNNYPQPEIQYDMKDIIKQMEEFQNEYKEKGRRKEPQLVYLYSDSIPKTTIRNVFKDAQKIKSISFTGCMRGFKGETSADLKKFMQQQVKKGEINNIPVRLDPFFFEDLGVKRVPALVYAECTTYPTQCDYKYIIYGDSSLTYLVEQIYKASGNKLIGQVLVELEN